MGRVAKACRTRSETRAPGQDSLHGREECLSTRCGNAWKQRPRMRISVARVPETCGNKALLAQIHCNVHTECSPARYGNGWKHGAPRVAHVAETSGNKLETRAPRVDSLYWPHRIGWGLCAPIPETSGNKCGNKLPCADPPHWPSEKDLQQSPPHLLNIILIKRWGGHPA